MTIPSPTKRAVLYVGYKCNLGCKFCYYRHTKEKTWHPLEQLCSMVQDLKIFYGNEFVDITGGEPTIYPDILSLVAYCRSIGIVPSCITNGQALANKGLCEAFQKVGIHDFLLSVHGLGETYEALSGKKGSSENQIEAMENLSNLGIPFRFNVVLTEPIAEQLPEILLLAKSYGVKIINLIMFNLFESWAQYHQFPEFDFRYSSMAPFIEQMIVDSEGSGVEVNVRYFPFCQLKGLETHIYNYQQLPFDPHEWDFNSWHDCRAPDPSVDWYLRTGREAGSNAPYLKNEKCRACALEGICDGFNSLYVDHYGFGEEQPYEGARTSDPRTFLTLAPKRSCFYFDSFVDRELEDPWRLPLRGVVGGYQILNGGGPTTIYRAPLSEYLESDTPTILQVEPEEGRPFDKIKLGYYDPPYHIEAKITGPARQVGFSFGACQDLYTSIPEGEHLLSLSVDGGGKWSLFLDGTERDPHRRDLGNLYVRPAEKVGPSFICLKSRETSYYLHEILVRRGKIDSPTTTIVVVCVGYARRLNFLLSSLARQTSRDFEIFVGRLHQRDDTDWVVRAHRSENGLPIREFVFDSEEAKNKSFMINTMMWESQAPRLLLTDADIIFPPQTLEELLRLGPVTQASAERCFLPEATTNQILMGNIDPVGEYPSLLSEYSHLLGTNGPDVLLSYPEKPALGYLQWLDGQKARRMGYCTTFKEFWGCDDEFSLALLLAEGESEVPLIQSPVLHLDHGDRNWYGLMDQNWL